MANLGANSSKAEKTAYTNPLYVLTQATAQPVEVITFIMQSHLQTPQRQRVTLDARKTREYSEIH